MNFEYPSLTHTVYFGEGKFAILDELLKSYSRVFVIASKRLHSHVERIKESIGNENTIVFNEVIQHVPKSLVDEAFRRYDSQGCDVLLAIGGGSAIGLAKAIALENGHPIIAVPTTFSGSEMTNIYGISSEGSKTTGRDNRVMPKHIIYDTDLTKSMPKHLAATSALNAMAHVMEAAYAVNSNPITYNNAFLGMKNLVEGMKFLAQENAFTSEANEKILFGAYLAGKCLGEVSMALHHKAAHVLGGSFGLEHSHVHSVMQSYVLNYQWNSLSEQVRLDFQKTFDDQNPAKKLREMSEEIGAPTTLKEIGFSETNIEKTAEIMASNPYPNPAPLTKEGLSKLLRDAFHGK